MDGKIIFEKKINKSLIDINEKIELENVVKGMYLVRISNGSQSSSKLIAIQ
jgi:Secretion system C-terminal sorting domain